MSIDFRNWNSDAKRAFRVNKGYNLMDVLYDFPDKEKMLRENVDRMYSETERWRS